VRVDAVDDLQGQTGLLGQRAAQRFDGRLTDAIRPGGDDQAERLRARLGPQVGQLGQGGLRFHVGQGRLTLGGAVLTACQGGQQKQRGRGGPAAEGGRSAKIE